MLLELKWWEKFADQLKMKRILGISFVFCAVIAYWFLAKSKNTDNTILSVTTHSTLRAPANKKSETNNKITKNNVEKPLILTKNFQLRPREIKKKTSADMDFISQLNVQVYEDKREGNLRFYEDLYAIDEKDIRPSDKIIDKKFSKVIVYSETFIDNSLRVVATDNVQFAIFTGVISIKLKDTFSILDVLENTDFKIQSELDYIKTYQVQFASKDDTLEIYDSLKSDPRVDRVSLEILKYERK